MEDFFWLILDALVSLMWWVALFVLGVIILCGVVVIGLVWLYAIALKEIGRSERWR